MGPTRLSYIDGKVQYGSQRYADILGQGFDVYRIGPTSNSTGTVAAENQIASNIPVVFERTTRVPDTEINLMAKIILFKADIDIRPYRIGDVFVERSDTVRADLSVFTLAYSRPLHDPVFVFTPTYGTITRPNKNPTSVDSGIAPRQTEEKDTDLILTLQNGQFSFKPDGIPFTVPICLQADQRRGEYPPKLTGLDDDVRIQEWHAYVPLLSGTTLIENDKIVGANGDRYRVHTPFPQFAGFQGQLLKTEKVRN